MTITSQAQWLTEEDYAARRKECEHPPERKRQKWSKSKRTGEAIRGGIKCRDCENERKREQYAKEATARVDEELAMWGKEGAAPSREVLAGAVCGHDMDERFITDPKFLTDADKAELATWCGNCPVREGCLEWAMEEKIFIGVAGGYTFAYTGKSGTRRVAEPLLKPVLTGYASQQDQEKESA